MQCQFSIETQDSLNLKTKSQFAILQCSATEPTSPPYSVGRISFELVHKMMSSRCHELGSETDTQYMWQHSVSVKQCWCFIQPDVVKVLLQKCCHCFSAASDEEIARVANVKRRMVKLRQISSWSFVSSKAVQWRFGWRRLMKLLTPWTLITYFSTKPTK